MRCKQRQLLKSVAFPLSPAAVSGLQDLKDGLVNYVQMVGFFLDKMASLESEHCSICPSEAISPESNSFLRCSVRIASRQQSLRHYGGMVLCACWISFVDPPLRFKNNLGVNYCLNQILFLAASAISALFL